MSDPGATPTNKKSGGLLDLIETIGNRLPDPATLFLIGTIIVMLLSWLATSTDWTVIEEMPKPVMVEQTAEDGSVSMVPQTDENGDPVLEWEETGREFRSTNLLTRDGLNWAISSIVDNFMGFAPLGVVLVGMLGIGIAERTKLMDVLLKGFMMIVPMKLLTPAMVFIGIMSSMATDAGYVVLPPLAALLYRSVGRSPLAGLAAVFAGVAAGFNANLLVTGLDPMLAELSTLGARTVDPEYSVAATCNWYFMIASTFVITLTGWAVTSFFVERRLNGKSPDEGGPSEPTQEDADARHLTAKEKKALKSAVGALVVVMAIIGACVFIKGAPLYTYKVDKIVNPQAAEADQEIRKVIVEPWEESTPGETPPEGAIEEDGVFYVETGAPFERWVDAIVPLLFFIFIVPGIAYGVSFGSIRNDKDLAKLLIESMAAMAPIIVLAFFAAQFIEHFRYSGLDRMLALAGGQMLGQADMPIWLLLVAFIAVTIIFNLFVGSMSAKYTMFAPIFVPMFMMVSISPELTQAAYRIGDSVSNIITPLNAYLIIVLVFMKQYVPKAGMGTLISTMLPYTLVFSVVWTIMLLIWLALGLPLGPAGPLTYELPSVANAVSTIMH